MLKASITLFPNNELRVRTVVAVPSKSKGAQQPSSVLPSHLTLGSNLQILPEGATKPESLQVRPGYGGLPGRKKFTILARRRLLRVGGVIDKAGYQSTMLTGTLPGSTNESMAAIAKWSAVISRTLKQWVADRCSHLPGFGWFFVWERQKRGALHIHFCVTFEGAKEHERLQSHFKSWWYHCLIRIGQLEGVDMAAREKGGTWINRMEKWQTDAQSVKKSVAAYLSKYFGKSDGKSSDEGVGAYYPSSWWGLSRDLLQRLRGSVATWAGFAGQGFLPHSISQVLQSISDFIVKSYRYDDRFGTGRNTVIYIKPEAYQKCRDEIAGLPLVESMDLNWSHVFKESFMPSTEYLTKIWSSTADRTAFFESLAATNQEIVYAWANSRLEKRWIPIIESLAKAWWYDKKINLQTNAQLRQRAQSVASLAEQRMLSFEPSPRQRAGGMASAERPDLSEGMVF